MKYLLGIDIGTSGTKTVLFNEHLDQIASFNSSYEITQPYASWAEQDPYLWWNATCEGIKGVICKSKINPESIIGIGLSGQMHGLVMLDENNQILRPSIIWCDQRTVLECGELTNQVGENKLIEITANKALTGFTASKIKWVEKNEKEVFNLCKKILLPKDYIRFCLTNEYATEVSDASGMQIIDIKTRKWSKVMMDALNIKEEMLGKVYESYEITGYVTEEAAALTGLISGIPVVGGAGDQAASAIGNGIVNPSTMSLTIGSSGVVFAYTDKPLIDKLGRVQTFCHAIPNKWHVMGVTQAAGVSMKWAKDQLCKEEIIKANETNTEVYTLINDEISKVNPGSDGLIYLPYLLGERTPHLDPYARGVFFGLTNMHTKEHMLKSVMEGVSYSLLDGYKVINELGISTSIIRIAGGGAKSDIWSQIIADVFNVTTLVSNVTDAGTLGCAILAGVGVGLFPSIEKACEKYIVDKKLYTPNLNNVEMYKKLYQIYQKLYISLKDNFKALNKVLSYEKE